MSRTEKSRRNMLVSFLGQTCILLISFITRSIFVKTLSTEFLGLNGLFTNIVNVLSLAELGVGVAITYSLYKPIAEDNFYEISAIMYFYKQIYKYIGIFIFFLGMIITPFVGLLIKDTNNVSNLKIYFMLFILNSVITYFYSYKQSLIIANQNSYIVSLNRYVFVFLRNLIQILVLVRWHSFLVYLLTQMFFTLMENFVISKIADKMYPQINTSLKYRLNDNTSNEIKKNTFAMVFHKIGSVVVNGTDNIIISKYVGLMSVGMYSNYWLIVSSLNSIFNQGFSSLTASIGNLGLIKTKEYSIKIFNVVYFINFWIYSFSAISLLILLNPFIAIWVGEDYLLPKTSIYLIVVNFYISGMRTGVNTFKNSYGLFWNDRYKPIVESLVNIIASLLLVQKYGLNGVLLGTIISTMTTSFWIEPYVLYNYAFNQQLIQYIKLYFKYSIITIILAITTQYISLLFIGSLIETFIWKVFICAVVVNISIVLLFINSDELRIIIEKCSVRKSQNNKN